MEQEERGNNIIGTNIIEINDKGNDTFIYMMNDRIGWNADTGSTPLQTKNTLE